MYAIDNENYRQRRHPITTIHTRGQIFSVAVNFSPLRPDLFSLTDFLLAKHRFDRNQIL